jgi:Mlc titration factor MtfA (ptsG expression regulator)
MVYLLSLAILAIALYFIWKPKQKKVEAFPEHWHPILLKNVAFYRHLDAEGQKRFQQKLMYFLAGLKITGVKTTVEELDVILIGASAVIPIFGFDEWEYTHVDEILLYPNTFNHSFQFSDQAEDKQILGMVGDGYLNGKMILSKNALRQGFQNQTDKRNTAIHEFVHLLDKEDGYIDGLPAALLHNQYSIPWLDMIHTKMEEINADESDIRNYGGTSKVEFFAVASEYFFERPDLFRRKHPEMYAMMVKCFGQEPQYRAKKKRSKR